MSSKKKSFDKQFKQNKVNRVEKTEKRYNKPKRSKSDKAYIEGDYRSSVSKRSYGVKMALKEGKQVSGYGDDYLDTKGMKRSNYVKKMNGENPYEAKYLYTGKPTTVKNKDGSTFTSRNRYLTKEEKASYENTGELYHKNYRKNKSFIDTETEKGGKFSDRLKTFNKDGMKLDGLETAMYNQKDGKHLKNIANIGMGLAKDFVGDPIFDVLKTFDRYESAVLNGVYGGVEQANHMLEGRGWQKGLIKDVVDHSLTESNETGWGTSSADNWRHMAERNGKDLNSFENTMLGGAGLVADVLNPIDIGGKVVNIGKGLLKGAKNAVKGVESATDVMSVAPGFKAGKASDDVFYGGKGNKSLDNTAIDRRLNKSYDLSTSTKDVVANKPKLNNFIEQLNAKPDKVGEQRRIDGRKLNKKYTQTKDGYVPRVLDDVVETSQKSDASLEQLNMFDKLKNNMYETPKNVAKYETSNVSELNLPQRKDAMMKFLGDKNVLNAPVENINSLKKIANRIKPKGANSKEIVEFLNKQMFNGDNVIVGNVNNKTLKQFLENEVKHLENSRKLRNTSNPVERTKLNLALNDTGNKRNQFISQLTDENLFDKQQYIKSKYGNSPSGFKKAINDNLEYIKKLQKGEVKLPDGSPYPNVNKEVDRLVAQNNEYNKLLKQATNERNSIGDLPDNKWIEFRSKNANKNNRVGLDDNAKRINTNVQETFENASMQTTNADSRELTNQKWQIAQRMNGNKSVGYFNKVVDNETKNLDIITRDMDDLLYDAMMGDKNASKKLKEYDVERDKIQAKIDNARRTKAKMIKDFNDIGKRLEGELDVNTAIAEMMNEAKSTNPLTYKKQKKVTYESLGNSKEASIARKLAEQHGIDEPIAMPTVIPELVRHNKEQIQKLVQLRVMQSFEGNKGKGSMNDAVNMLIKSHMDNMKKSMPNDYDKLVEGVGKYKDDLRKAYMSYKNAKGSVTTNPLNKIGGNFYEKATKEANDVSGVKLKMDLQKLARSFVEGDVTPNNTKPIKPKTTPLETIPDATDVSKSDNTPLNKIPSFLQDAKLKELDEKIAGRLTPERMEEILGSPLEKIFNVDEVSKAPRVGGEEITPGWRRNSDKGDVPPGTTYDDVAKNNKPMDRTSDEQFSRNILDEIANTTDDIDVKDIPKELPKGSGAIDEITPSNDVVKQLTKEAKELKKQGIDVSQEPPKKKPKDMSPNLYNKWLNAWKKGVTVYNPGWHVQNFFQNKGQNYFALGNKAFLPQTDAKNVLKASQGKAFKDVNINGMDAKQLSQLAQDLGVMDSFGDDIQMANKGIMSKIDNSKPMKKLQEIEPTARLNHWLKQMESGMSPEKARDSVNKYLYDYSDQSKLDKAIKNVDPFWMFHKNNARMLTQSAVEHPSRMNNIMRGQRGLEGEIPEEQRQSEDSKWREFQDGNKTYTDKEGRQYNYLYDQQMFSDIGDAFPLSEDEVMGKLNPLLQVAIRAMKGEGSFGNEIVSGDAKPGDGFQELFYEDVGFGKESGYSALKNAMLDLNPIAPSVAKSVDKLISNNKNVKDGKMDEEMEQRKAFMQLINQLTGNKGDWYRNLK